MGDPDLLVEESGPILTVTFNRPARRNAMTWQMYDGLADACERAGAGDGIRVLVLRGAGEKAFVAGTDIAQFTGFRTGADGLAYERRISGVLGRLESVPVPTVAAVRGYCVGGGLGIAAVCDLRIAADDARFGVPIARTLGNCLSMNSYDLLVRHLGPARALDMLLRARMLTAAEAQAAGFVAEVCEPAALPEVTGKVVDRLLEHAPLSMWAAKEAVRRLRMAALPDGDDIVERVFGSEDFQGAVHAFVDREKPTWNGR